LTNGVFGCGIAGRDFGDAEHVTACWADCSKRVLAFEIGVHKSSRGGRTSQGRKV
jgi:hypothetical protein